MRSWFDSSKRRKGLDIEAELRASRPEAPGHLVRSITNRLSPRPLRSRSRIGFVGALAAASIAVLGATGGFSYAATGIASAVHSVGYVTHVAPPPPPTTNPGGPGSSGGSGGSGSSGASSAGAQYVPAPHISSLAPTHGTVGTNVAVSGTNLSKPTNVTLNGTKAKFRGVNSSTVDFTVPTGALTGPVVVTTAGGSSNGVSFTVDAAPTASNITPNTAVEPGQELTITGTNLGDVTSVLFGKTKATPEAWNPLDPTHLKVMVPVVAGGKPGSSQAIALGYAGGTAPTGLTVTLAPGPILKAIDKKTGLAGTTIKLTGSGFDRAADTVTIAGTTLAKVNCGTKDWTATNACVQTDGSVTEMGAVTITDGIGTSAGPVFTPIVTPNPTGASPAVAGEAGTFGSAANGTVTITGTHLWGTTEVDWANSSNSKPAVGKGPKVSTDGTSLTVKVPANAANGKVTVVNAAASTQLSSPTFFLVQKPTFATPQFTQTGAHIVVSGANFAGLLSVSVGKASISLGSVTLTIGSPDTIAFDIPSNTPNGTITIANAAGKITTKTSAVGTPTIKSVVEGKPSGGVVTLTLNGTGFNGTNGAKPTVTYDGNPVPAGQVTLDAKSPATKLTISGITTPVKGSSHTVQLTSDVGSGSSTFKGK